MPSFFALSARLAEMPEPGNTMTPDRQDGEHLIVAPEGRGLGVAGPVGLEGDLGDLAGVGPGGGDALGAPRGAAVQQHHAGMLGVNLVEPVPDRAVVVEVET